MSPPEHPAHLIPDFLHVYLLSFLNLPLLPVRFLGQAHAGHKTVERSTWKRNYVSGIITEM
jgi:hypothetical protein